MIDIHTHILPGVDDGAKDFAEVKKIAKSCLKQRVNCLVATPHYMEGKYEINPSELKSKYKNLESRLHQAGINLKILIGNEVYLREGIINKIKENRVLSLNHSRYMLVEFPIYKLDMKTESRLYQIKEIGYQPIIAHPERYKFVQRDPNLVSQWNKEGIAVQINGASLLGDFGQEEKETADFLLENNLVQLIASDLHSYNLKGQSLQQALLYLSSKVSKQQIARLVRNAKAVILNQELDFGILNKELDEIAL
jgi:protein-tyrosine phosphatase